MLRDLIDIILSLTGIDCELVAIDGIGHVRDYPDKYYEKTNTMNFVWIFK